MKLQTALLRLLLALPLAHLTAHAQDATSPALADFTSCAKPVWPQASLRNSETGTVTLKFRIETDGTVGESAVVKSSGFPLLDMAAQDGIGRCKFKPATRDGKPVQTWMPLQYVWKLNDKPVATAQQWRDLKAGAERGDAESEYQLAQLYLYDVKSKRDAAEADRLLKSAVAKNHVGAQFQMAIMLGKSDVAESAELYRKAAEQGHMLSQHMLGMMLLSGKGVAKDVDAAIGWFRKASEQGHTGSASHLGTRLVLTGRTASDIAEGVALLRRGVAAHDMQAQYALGLCYENGRGVDADWAQAAALYNKAALAGHQAAKLAATQLAAKEATAAANQAAPGKQQ